MVRFVNIDNPDDAFEIPSLGYGVGNDDKGPGKAVSYAVKYALLKALGLETGDDADLEEGKHKLEDPAASLSPEQFSNMKNLLGETESDETKFLKHFGAASVEQFPPSKYKAAIDMLEAKRNQSKPDLSEELSDEIPH